MFWGPAFVERRACTVDISVYACHHESACQVVRKLPSVCVSEKAGMGGGGLRISIVENHLSEFFFLWPFL